MGEVAVRAEGGQKVAEAVAAVRALPIARAATSRPAFGASYALPRHRRLQLDHQHQNHAGGGSHLETERRHWSLVGLRLREEEDGGKTEDLSSGMLAARYL